MGGWIELPSDLINANSQRLETYVDYVRLGALCAYRRLGVRNSEDHLNYGWVVTIENGPELNLFNPFSKVRIALPPIYTFPDVKWYCAGRTGNEYAITDRLGHTFDWSHKKIQEIYVKKLILASPPHDDYLAIAIYGESNSLAFCRSNDKKWTAAEPDLGGFWDVIFYEDKIYALKDGKNAALMVSDMCSLPKFKHIKVELPDEPYMENPNPKLYLVGSNSGVMMVARFQKEEIIILDGTERFFYKTIGFEFYLLESEGKQSPCWTEITTVGNNVIFLGFNASILIPSLHFPKLKGNCVYYTDDEFECCDPNEYGGFDIGVFDIEDGCIKEFGELNLDNHLVWPPPVWVMPTP